MLRFVMTAVLAIGTLASWATAEEPIRGHLVLNGGGSKPAVVMEKFIELAGGTEALIVVFPTASEEADTGEYYQELFERYGCAEVRVAEVQSEDHANDSKIAALVRKADGIWFSGGDQRRITRALIGTEAGKAVADAFRRGAVVGGTSAGTACQSSKMITGDGDFSMITADNVELWDGLALFDGVIVDQHFVARKRHNRLMSVVLEHPGLVGVGVDEATAVWVRPNGTFEVLGDGWVVVYDATDATVNRAAENRLGNPLGVHGMTLHILLPGDAFDIGRRVVVSPSGEEGNSGW